MAAAASSTTATKSAKASSASSPGGPTHADIQRLEIAQATGARVRIVSCTGSTGSREEVDTGQVLTLSDAGVTIQCADGSRVSIPTAWIRQVSEASAR